MVASLAACDPKSPPPPPPPDPTILYSFGFVSMSGGNWDLSANIGVTVHAYSYARRPTTLTLTSAALYPPTDPGMLTTLSLTVVNPQLAFAGVDDEYVTLSNSGTLNRALAPACGPVRVVLVFHSSSCGCDVRVEGSGAVGCYADNGADPELAATGTPAPAGKPCGARHYSTSGGVETLDGERTYRYDTEGRLLFSDELDTTNTFLERVYYTYESGVFLRKRESISPIARAVTSRSTYGYTSGVLSTIERDGNVAKPPDGVPDATWTYGFTGDVWTETDSTKARTYTYDPGALTVSRSDAVFHLLAPVDTPSRFFATTFLDGPRLSSSEFTVGTTTANVTYTYDGGALVEVRTSDVLGASSREEYLYVCP
jgi:hypothetical protein